MRVLMVTVPLPSDDDPNTMAPLARQIDSLRARGVHVDVLEVRGISGVKYLQAIPGLWARAARVDVVHAHFGYCGWLGRLQWRKPLVISFMGDDLLGTPDGNGRVSLRSRLAVRINRGVARTAAAVIVKSVEMAEVVKPVPAHVVPNGIHLPAFRPMDARQARALLGWPEGKRYVLFPGNPDNPRKQYRLAHAVVKKAAERMQSPLELVALKRVAADKVPLYMNACDAMTMTSYIEGSPNVVKEAMACNLPVVSVAVGDTRELLDGVPGYVVCRRDVDALATALVHTLTERGAVGGRSAIREKGLSLECVAQRLMDIYADVIHAHPG